jgi:hypothetical protein
VPQVREVMGLVVAHAQRAATFDKKLYVVYVINDVVHRCKKVREAGAGAGSAGDEANSAESIVAGIRDHLPTLLRSALQTQDAVPAQKDRIIKVLKLWADRDIFERSVVGRIEVRLQR